MKTNNLEEAAALLREGEVVAFPTETVYGLGASVFLPKAVEKIYQVKGRPKDNPLIVHIADLTQLALVVDQAPDLFYTLAHTFFPGPLTVLLPKKAEVPSIVSADLPQIGVRMPAHPLARRLIRMVGPLVAPSANLSGRPSSTTAQHVMDDFGDAIAGVLDGGSCGVGLESTVLMLEPKLAILRPGAVSKEQLESVLKKPVAVAEGEERPLCPGMKYRHYAPRAQVCSFMNLHELEEHIQASPNRRRLVLKSVAPVDLYAFFRLADAQGYEEIAIFCDEQMQQNSALMNRIHKASH